MGIRFRNGHENPWFVVQSEFMRQSRVRLHEGSGFTTDLRIYIRNQAKTDILQALPAIVTSPSYINEMVFVGALNNIQLINQRQKFVTRSSVFILLIITMSLNIHEDIFFAYLRIRILKIFVKIKNM